MPSTPCLRSSFQKIHDQRSFRSKNHIISGVELKEPMVTDCIRPGQQTPPDRKLQAVPTIHGHRVDLFATSQVKLRCHWQAYTCGHTKISEPDKPDPAEFFFNSRPYKTEQMFMLLKKGSDSCVKEIGRV